MSRFSLRPLISIGTVLALLGLAPSAASAMTVTSTGESGCSLRAAIQAVAANNSGTSCGAVVSGGPTPINLSANTYTPFDGQIVVPAGVNIQINGDNVNNPQTTVIDGTGATAGRIFEIKLGATVKLSGLTVTGGQALNGQQAATRFEAFVGEDGGGILNQGNLTLDHTVVTGNQAGDGGNGADGAIETLGGPAGAGGNGGGIYNADSASLTITDSTISDNIAGDGGDGGDGGNGFNAIGHFPNGSAGGNGARGGSGGGIFNSNFGILSVDRSTISENQGGRGGNGGAGGLGAGPAPVPPPGSGEFSGGTGGDGGDGGNNGRLLRKDGNPPFDEALGGGGIYNLGSMTMTNSTVNGNNTGAGGNGGPSGAGGEKNTGSNTFQSSGRAGWGGGGGRGGGLLNGSWHQGSITLQNVTITGNLTGNGGAGGAGGGGATSTLGGGKGGIGGDGGGIWAQGSHDNVTLLTHATIVKNFLGVAGPGGGSANGSAGPGVRGVGAGIAVGGRYNPSGAGVYLKNSLISANGFSGNPTFDKNCSQFQPVTSYQEFVDQGSNLSYPLDGSPCPGQTNVDPDLGPLGDNGGPTRTILPQPGSAAIGGVPLGSCTVTTDQRGNPRPGSDGSCDIGAVETDGSTTLTPTTTSLVSSLNPSTVGQQVTFTATVSPPPSSGTVAFSDGGTTVAGCGSAALKPGGQFTCSTSFPTAGTHEIFALYTGNSLFAGSVSLTYDQIVNGPAAKAKISKNTVIGPSRAKKGSKPTFTAKITNGGNAAATGVNLKVTGGGANISKKVGGIPAGSTKVVKVAIKLNQAGRKTFTFRATSANAGSKSTTKTVTVRRPKRHRH
ncbi:MAG: Ig-like domain repeat protein [Solirubrobacterales bacterium]|nr:Ig-like domain repeat protein [Solirubrobacterales bacterium]